MPLDSVFVRCVYGHVRRAERYSACSAAAPGPGVCRGALGRVQHRVAYHGGQLVLAVHGYSRRLGRCLAV